MAELPRLCLFLLRLRDSDLLLFSLSIARPSVYVSLHMMAWLSAAALLCSSLQIHSVVFCSLSILGLRIAFVVRIHGLSGRALCQPTLSSSLLSSSMSIFSTFAYLLSSLPVLLSYPSLSSFVVCSGCRVPVGTSVLCTTPSQTPFVSLILPPPLMLADDHLPLF